MKQIRLRLLELGTILQQFHGDVNPYDVVTSIKGIIHDTYNPDWNEYEHKRRLIANIKDWFKKENFDLRGIELVDVIDNYFVMTIPDNLGKQLDMFDKNSLLPLLQNAGLR